MTTKKVLAIFCAITAAYILAAASPAFSQAATENKLVIMGSSSTVYVITTGLPADGISGINIYRSDAGATDFKKLNDSPIEPAKTGNEVTEILGPAAPDFLSALELKTADEFFTDYPKQKGRYNLLSIFSLELNKVLGRLYIDKDVQPGSKYSYKVALLNSSGSETKTIGPADITVTPVVLPTPKNFALTAGDSNVHLTWAKPSEDFRGIGWNVFRSESKTGPFVVANKKLISILGDQDKDVKNFHDVMLENGKTFYYYAQAVDLAGNTSEPTETLEAKTKDSTPPRAPTGVEVKLEEEKAILTWKVNMEPDLASYDVWRGDTQEDEKTYTKLNQSPLGPETVTFTDPEVTEGVARYYRISAADKSGNVSPRSAAASILPPDKTPPSSPIQVAGKPGGKDFILLTWEPNKEKDLHGYFLYRGASPETMTKINPGSLDKALTQYEDHSIVSGESYYYTVAAVDIAQNISVQSTPILVKAPDTVPPDFPSNLFAKAEDRKVTLNWPASQEKDLAGYRLYRVEKEGAKKEEFTKIGEDIKKDLVQVDDEAVKNGTNYWYFLTAFDESGNESDRSSIVVALPRDYVPPEPPTSLAGVPDEKSIALQWVANTEDDIAGYKVLRSDIKTGVYEEISGEKLLPASQLEFKDESVPDGKEVWYRVVAMDTSGNNSNRSDAAGPLAKVVPQPETTGTDKTDDTDKKDDKQPVNK